VTFHEGIKGNECVLHVSYYNLQLIYSRYNHAISFYARTPW